MPKSKAVKLVSAEGWEFVVDFDAACVSNTIKNMLSSQGALCNAPSERGLLFAMQPLAMTLC